MNSRNKSSLEKLKSDFFLQKLYSYMKKNKSLNIMKYNQKLQKRLNLSIKDYKEFSQLYTPIEIELQPVGNRYDVFINIPEKEKDYYHIYFDNSKEEIKRNKLNKKEKIKLIKIIIDYQVKSFKNLFSHIKCIDSITFKKYYKNNITDMSFLFAY